MVKRPRTWFTVSALFTLGNVAGGVFAGLQGEPLHAGTHAALTLLGAWWVWWVVEHTGRPEQPGAALSAARIEQLQQSVDAVAIEVERLGEAQRYREKLQTERDGKLQ